MSEGIENAAAIMARHEIIERLYLYSPTRSSSSEMQLLLLRSCIINVYTNVLKYLAKARNFWSYNTANRMATAVLTSMESENKDLQLAMSKADDETYRLVHLLQDQQTMGEFNAVHKRLDRLQQDLLKPVFRLANSISNIDDKHQKDQRKETIRWLSTVPCEIQHQEAASKFVIGTGRWLLDRPELLN